MEKPVRMSFYEFCLKKDSRLPQALPWLKELANGMQAVYEKEDFELRIYMPRQNGRSYILKLFEEWRMRPV